MEIPITLITSGILGLLFFIHSIRIIKVRRSTRTNLGDGGDESMLRRIRIHANFAEYIPLLLFFLLLLEINDVTQILLIVFSLLIISGRILHFYGLFSKETPGWARVIGIHFTLWPLMLGSMYLVYLGIF